MGRACRALLAALLVQLLHRPFVVSQAANQNNNAGGKGAADQGGTQEFGGNGIADGSQFKFRGREWHPESFGFTNCSSPVPKVDENANIFGCRILRDVCVDQGVIIYQDSRYHPWTSEVRLPLFNISDILWNTPSLLGIGDKWKAGKNRYQPVPVRPWHHMEESDDVRKPVFSNCTTPLLFYHHFPFNVAEVYRFAVNNIFFLQQRLHFFDDHITLVPGNPAMSRVPSFTRFWLQPFSRYEVTSLGALSERRQPGSPSNSTGEGLAGRCFSKFIMCKITLKKPTGAYYEAGQFVAQHYMKKAQPLEANYTARLSPTMPPDVLRNASVLKVVFAVRSKSHKDVGRMLLNEDELIDRCNLQELPLANDTRSSVFRSVHCIRHIFGVDNMYDMWLVRQFDVLVGVHGSALTNAMFMRRGSSLIELRPFGFSGRESWPNIYMKAQTRNMEVFWFGIDVMNETLSTPGDFESDMQPIYTRARGCLARDRNLIVPWAALAHQLHNIAVVSRSLWRYKVLRYSHAYYVTHDLQAVELPGKDRRVPVEVQTWFKDLDEERARAAAIPLTKAGEAAARAAEEALMNKLEQKWEAQVQAREEAKTAEAAGVTGGDRDAEEDAAIQQQQEQGADPGQGQGGEKARGDKKEPLARHRERMAEIGKRRGQGGGTRGAHRQEGTVEQMRERVRKAVQARHQGLAALQRGNDAVVLPEGGGV